MTLPENEWCHHQHTVCKFAARYQLIHDLFPVRDRGGGDHCSKRQLAQKIFTVHLAVVMQRSFEENKPHKH